MNEELPRRPRRKLVTPLTATLAAVLIAAVGFAGGVQVQKSSADTPSGGFARGGGATGGFSPTGGSSDATVGTVANVGVGSGPMALRSIGGNRRPTRTAGG